MISLELLHSITGEVQADESEWAGMGGYFTNKPADKIGCFDNCKLGDFAEHLSTLKRHKSRIILNDFNA